MNQASHRIGTPRSKTGVPGLDDILGGGFVPNRLYLIEGDPGTGKTTLALRYLLEGNWYPKRRTSTMEIPAAFGETELMRTEAGHVERKN